jgi:microcystin-dependent protein
VTEPFIGEIRVISFNFPPRGWAFCNSQLLQITQNQALFSILGTMYGGDGRTTFALPNLQGRVPLHQGSGYAVGQVGGEASHTLTQSEMPAHVHPSSAASDVTTTSPANAVWGTSSRPTYAASPDGLMNPATVSTTGGGQPHENFPPYLVLNFVIALVGIFPSRN